MRRILVLLTALFLHGYALAANYDVLYIKSAGSGVLAQGTVVDICAVGYNWTAVQRGIFPYADGAIAAIVTINVPDAVYDGWAIGTAYLVNNVDAPTSFVLANP